MEAILPILVLIEKIAGFLKQIIIAQFFGTTNYTDAYQLAENIISIVRGAFANSVPVVFLTALVYKKVKKEKSKYLIRDVTAYGTVLLLVISTIILGISSFVRILYNDSLFLKNLCNFVIILSPTILLGYISGIFSSVLESEKKYWPSKIVSLLTSIFVVIFVVLLFERISITSILLGEIVALIVHIILLLYLIQRNKYDFMLGGLHESMEAKKIFRNAIPLMLSASIYSINSLVDKAVALSIKDGAATVLQYARIISLDLFPSIIVTAFSGVLIREFSRSVAQNDYNKVEESVGVILESMFCFLTLVAIVSFVNARGLITFVYKRGSFNELSVNMTQIAFLGYVIGIPFYSIREVLSRVHYSYEDTHTPFKSSLIGVIINIMLSIVLAQKIGLYGIAIATTISIMTSSLLNYLALRKKKISLKKNIISIVKMIPVFVFLILVCIGINHIFGDTLIALIASSISCVILFYIITYSLRLESSQFVIGRIREKIGEIV